MGRFMVTKTKKYIVRFMDSKMPKGSVLCPYRTSRVDQSWSRVIPVLGALSELCALRVLGERPHNSGTFLNRVEQCSSSLEFALTE